MDKPVWSFPAASRNARRVVPPGVSFFVPLSTLAPARGNRFIIVGWKYHPHRIGRAVPHVKGPAMPEFLPSEIRDSYNETPPGERMMKAFARAQGSCESDALARVGNTALAERPQGAAVPTENPRSLPPAQSRGGRPGALSDPGTYAMETRHGYRSQAGAAAQYRPARRPHCRAQFRAMLRIQPARSAGRVTVASRCLCSTSARFSGLAARQRNPRTDRRGLAAMVGAEG